MEGMNPNLRMIAVVGGVLFGLLTWAQPAVPPGAPLPRGGLADRQRDGRQHGDRAWQHDRTGSSGQAGQRGQADRSLLRQALLDATDFPQGWASDSWRAAGERGIGVPRPEEPACRGLFDSRAAISARAGFARTPTGPFVTTVATAHGGDALARRALDAFQAVAEKCATFHTREGPRGETVTVAYEAAEPDPRLAGLDGEPAVEHAALRYRRQPADGADSTAVVADVLIARVGAHTVRVAQAGRDDDGGTGSLAELAARAVAKLRQVAAGATPSPPPRQPGTTEL